MPTDEDEEEAPQPTEEEPIATIVVDHCDDERGDDSNSKRGDINRQLPPVLRSDIRCRHLWSHRGPTATLMFGLLILTPSLNGNAIVGRSFGVTRTKNGRNMPPIVGNNGWIFRPLSSLEMGYLANQLKPFLSESPRHLSNAGPCHTAVPPSSSRVELASP